MRTTRISLICTCLAMAVAVATAAWAVVRPALVEPAAPTRVAAPTETTGPAGHAGIMALDAPADGDCGRMGRLIRSGAI